MVWSMKKIIIKSTLVVNLNISCIHEVTLFDSVVNCASCTVIHLRKQSTPFYFIFLASDVSVRNVNLSLLLLLL